MDEAGGSGSIAEVAWLVSEQTRSGQSAAKFCRERGISVWQFYGWKKRLVELEARILCPWS
jgi:hypothetical protein